VKNFVSGFHLALIIPASQHRSAQRRTTMVGKISWIVFTMRVLVEKHISGPRPSLALFCRRPCSARKKYLFNTKKTSAIQIADLS